MINLCEHCWPHLEHAETKRFRARILLQFCYRLFRAIVFPLLLSVAFSQTKQSLSSTKRNAGSNSSFPFSSPSFNVACEEDMPKDGIVITQHFQNRLTPCMSFFFLFFLFFFFFTNTENSCYLCSTLSTPSHPLLLLLSY